MVSLRHQDSKSASQVIVLVLKPDENRTESCIIGNCHPLSLSLSLSALNLLRSHWDLDWIYWDPVRSRQDLVRYGPDHLRSTRDLIDIRRNLVSTTLAISSKTNRHPAKPKLIWSVPGVGPWRVYFCSTRSSRVGYELSLNPIWHDLWTTLL